MEGKIYCRACDLQLHVTFNCGQCYRWNLQKDGSWIGVFHHCIWTVKHENDHLFYKVNGNYKRALVENDNLKDILPKYLKAANISEQNIGDEVLLDCLLWDYFRLFEDLDKHYRRWSECDSNFREKADKFYGLRMLKQDSEEILITFVCSSNTTIKRITGMVEKLCSMFGEKVGEVNGNLYYDFPDISKLAKPSVVKELQMAKFGYRASYIVESACKIMQMGGKDWFRRLNSLTYREAKLEMTKLSGIGEKVADCICLMGLDHLNAIPVDTHVFQISKRYIPELRDKKTVNTSTYRRIGNHFRDLFGYHAGWAHVVLFCADLKMHQPVNSNAPIKKNSRNKRLSKVVVSKYFAALNVQSTTKT
uniref:N-glycosylase/DNA lyase n=1 Tax=Graphocephala atropunctata TaxID=36148 RepID=A0A1B6L4H6_9HEMI